eukprot:1392403-Pyramimonas_sp.AAC.1
MWPAGDPQRDAALGVWALLLPRPRWGGLLPLSAAARHCPGYPGCGGRQLRPPEGSVWRPTRCGAAPPAAVPT